VSSGTLNLAQPINQVEATWLASSCTI